MLYNFIIENMMKRKIANKIVRYRNPPKWVPCGSTAKSFKPDETGRADRFRLVIPIPTVFFFDGDISLLSGSKKLLAIVGSRKSNETQMTRARNIGVWAAKKGFIVINGMADGIDRAAAEGALSAGGKVVFVLGTDIADCYPEASRSIYDAAKAGNGLIISEYSPGTKTEKDCFIRRDHIIAALCDAMVIGQINGFSGTLATVKAARNLDKPVGLADGATALAEEWVEAKLNEFGAVPAFKGSDIIALFEKR